MDKKGWWKCRSCGIFENIAQGKESILTVDSTSLMASIEGRI